MALALLTPGAQLHRKQQLALFSRKGCTRGRARATFCPAVKASLGDSLRQLELRIALERSVQNEDYASAARLRDELRQHDPAFRVAADIAAVKQQLQEATSQEQFQASKTR